MSVPGPTRYWRRLPAVSACREGANLILFDADRAREKVVNRAGGAVWDAMDGVARTEDLAAALARRYDAPRDIPRPAIEAAKPEAPQPRRRLGGPARPRRCVR